MGSVTRKAQSCRECRYSKTCQNKEMQLEAYAEENIASTASMPLLQPLIQDNSLRSICPDGTKIQINLKEVEKQINKSFGLMFGA